MKRCSDQSLLGQQLASLHLDNQKRRERGEQCVEKFGFDVDTCCGFLPQSNTWNSSWLDFYTHKLEEQISMQPTDAELQQLWSSLKKSLEKLFLDVDVFPSLLHGDLWGGNIGQVGDDPVIFDPASFYGHHEYDLAIGKMFGGFNRDFHQSYHSIIPKQPGFEERSNLYQLFHYLNHWNHFGDGYRGQSISLLKGLVKNVSK